MQMKYSFCAHCGFLQQGKHGALVSQATDLGRYGDIIRLDALFISRTPVTFKGCNDESILFDGNFKHILTHSSFETYYALSCAVFCTSIPCAMKC